MDEWDRKIMQSPLNFISEHIISSSGGCMNMQLRYAATLFAAQWSTYVACLGEYRVKEYTLRDWTNKVRGSVEEISIGLRFREI